MSVQTVDPLSEPELRLQIVQIKRMELFVVALNDNKWIRYQVILFLTANTGQAWSDMVLENWQKPADWITWSSRFRDILGSTEPCNPGLLLKYYHEETLQSVLVSTALEQLKINPGYNLSAIKSVLFDRASSYISLF
ncbi:hypothetical protein [Paenibacillus nasutitermitis]|uniref:Uncharacterized protein n=1 Tax=Paenibacillus nasutitermitis TaxID=1652958 RepID=A0A917DMR4_9BACL|nr:hypothetical protein [Paenibacillus nasutitermitis]GGD53367.1 hypothetical protein GCM10010911_08680 [Paenibacillus nasutitermitis]